MGAEVFREFDRFSAAIRDLDVLSLVPREGERKWCIEYEQVGRLAVQCINETNGLIHQCKSRAGGVCLLVLLKSRGAVRLNGQPIEAGTVCVTGPNADLCLALDGPNQWALLSLPGEVVMDCAPRWGAELLGPPVCRSYAVPDSLWLPLAAALGRPDRISRESASPAIASPAHEDVLLRVLAPVLGAACQASPRHKGRRPLSRERLVALAIDRIQRCPGMHVPVDTLAQHVGISSRTLLTIFHDYFGLSPLRYMRLRRLHAIHAALRSPHSRTSTVTSIATSFWAFEFGRLAQEYYRLFGEYPSRTLATGMERLFPRAALEQEIPAEVVLSA